MKQIYLILIAFFTLLSCSSDDNGNNQEEDNTSTKVEAQIFEVELEVKTEQRGYTFDITFNRGGGKERYEDGNSNTLNISKTYKSISPGIILESFRTIPTQSIKVVIKNLSDNTVPAFETIRTPVSVFENNPARVVYDLKEDEVNIFP